MNLDLIILFDKCLLNTCYAPGAEGIAWVEQTEAPDLMESPF